MQIPLVLLFGETVKVRIPGVATTFYVLLPEWRGEPSSKRCIEFAGSDDYPLAKR